jgi:hypothetical protein
MIKIILPILIVISSSSLVWANDPYPINGKTFFAVNMAKKTCNEIEFGVDQKFKLQTEDLGTISGTYEYTNGLLTMTTADVPVFQKVKFQKFQENDGKLAVLMENLIESGVVNMYGNKKFCDTVKMRIVKLSETFANQDCAKLSFSDVPILETVVEKKKADGGSLTSKARWMELYNEACSKSKCLMARDKISFSELKSHIVKTGATPYMKKMQSDAIDELDLKTCSQ